MLENLTKENSEFILIMKTKSSLTAFSNRTFRQDFQAGLLRMHIIKWLFAVVVLGKSWKIIVKCKDCSKVCADFTANCQLDWTAISFINIGVWSEVFPLFQGGVLPP